MNLSRGARRYFSLIQKFIAKYGAWGFFASQRWIAAKLGASVRSVKRWLAELRAAGKIATRRRSQETSLYNILAPQMAPRIKEESATQIVVSPTEKQNHPDDAASLAETARKSAGLERLSEGDRRYLAELQRAGTPTEAIRAGILVGRARRMVADHNQGRRQPIRSLRYFAALFAEKFEAGYVEHVAGWLQRRSV